MTVDIENLLQEVEAQPKWRKIRNELRWKWNRVRRLPGKVRHYYERARYGYSYQDLWGLDWHLANLISKSVSDLEKITHGYPDPLTFEEWQQVLCDISEGFALLSSNEFYDLTPEQQVKVDRAWELFKKYFRALWD